jgi:exodeoxyribonuclease VII large subunit
MSEGTGAKGTNLVPLQALNQRLKRIVEQQTRGKPVQVWGLVTDVLRMYNGHYYIRLRQGGYGLRCFVSRELARELDFEIEEEQTLRVLGEVRVYERRGELELYAQQVELEAPATEDEELEALKRRAKAAGWLDPARKKPMPCPPQGIGLVAGRRSRARDDVIRSLEVAGLEERPIFEATWMGGEETAGAVRAALTKLNSRFDVDVIVIARGGGSKEELDPFNDWEVTRAIAESRVPVVTAIGHWQDRTLADMVADRSVPTPSLVGGALRGPEAEGREAAGEGPAGWPGARREVASVALAVGALVVLLALLGRVLGWW